MACCSLPVAAAYVLVGLLLRGLDAPKHRQRECCQRAMREAAPLVVPLLESASLRHPRPEVARRCRLLYGPHEFGVCWSRALAMRPRRWPRVPWIDAEQYVIDHYMVLGRTRSADDKAPTWAAWRWATTEWVASQLRQRRPTEEILDALDRMAEAERNWIRVSGGNYSPPVTMPAGH